MIKKSNLKKISFAGVISFFLLLQSPLLSAQSAHNPIQQLKTHPSDTIGEEYYLIIDPLDETSSESNKSKQIGNSLNPIDSIKSIAQQALGINEPTEFNLLEWTHHKNNQSEDYEAYDRKSHFGSWIKDPQHKTCLNVRGLVLVRDAHGEVTYDDENKCRVVSADWIDPYTHEEIHSAEDMQIDHVVPLKDAYTSGAWEWSNPKRCNYANFLGNNFHLLPVLGTENNKKSDSAPDEYIPPYKDFVCQYILDWLKIKSIWNLKMSEEEANGIKADIKQYSCSLEDFKLSLHELNNQRELVNEFPSACANR